MTSITNCMNWLIQNWFWVVICFGLVIVIVDVINNFMKSSKNEKKEVLTSLVKAITLSLVTEAEEKYSEMEKSGAIKNSYVVNELYKQIPDLDKVFPKDELDKLINEAIQLSLNTYKGIINNSNDNKKSVAGN